MLTERILSCVHIFGRLFGQGTKHREGAWRAWRLSGALLEFSAWSSRQSPCLQHHLSSSACTEQDALAQLQQQLHVRRKARQAAVEEERRRRKRSRGQDSSGDDSADAAGYDFGQRPGGYSGRSWQGCVLWSCVLVVVAGWCVGRKGVLLLAPVAAAGAAVYCISSGVLLPNEAAVQQLARVFDEDGSAAILVRVTHWAWVGRHWLTRQVTHPACFLAVATNRMAPQHVCVCRRICAVRSLQISTRQQCPYGWLG